MACYFNRIHLACCILTYSKITEHFEQSYRILFCQVETILKIQWVFGNDAMSVTQIKEFYNRFNGDLPSANSKSFLAGVQQVLTMKNCSIIACEFPENIGISIGSVQSILIKALSTKRLYKI